MRWNHDFIFCARVIEIQLIQIVPIPSPDLYLRIWVGTMNNHEINMAGWVVYITYCDACFTTLVYKQHVYNGWDSLVGKNCISDANLIYI